MLRLASGLMISLFVQAVYSYVPPIEGLFRNNNVPEITANALEISLLVKEQSVQGVASGEEGNGGKNSYLKLIFSTEGDGRAKVIQALFDERGMKMEYLRELAFIPTLSDITRVSGDQIVSKKFFYSVISMFVMDNSRVIIDFLNSANVRIPYNRSQEDQEKLKFLRRYKDYLQQQKDSGAKGRSGSPLQGDSPNEQEKIRSLLAREHYVSSDLVRLVKDGEIFYWQVSNDKFNAYFSNDEHLLRRMILNTNEGELEMNFSDYGNVSGIQDLPKYIVYRTADEIFIVQTLSLKHYNLRPDAFFKKYSELKDAHAQNLKSGRSAAMPTLFKPKFVY